MRLFLKNCYSIYFTLYLLWVLSAAIIISDEGFNFAKDMPWFLLFTFLLIIFWVMKYFFANDSRIIFHQNIATLNVVSHLLFIVIMSITMVCFR